MLKHVVNLQADAGPMLAAQRGLRGAGVAWGDGALGGEQGYFPPPRASPRPRARPLSSAQHRLRDAWLQLEEARQLCLQMEGQLSDRLGGQPGTTVSPPPSG